MSQFLSSQYLEFTYFVVPELNLLILSLPTSTPQLFKKHTHNYSLCFGDRIIILYVLVSEQENSSNVEATKPLSQNILIKKVVYLKHEDVLWSLNRKKILSPFQNTLINGDDFLRKCQQIHIIFILIAKSGNEFASTYRII